MLNINFDDFSVGDKSGNNNNGINTNVTFGVVENFIVTLVLGTDYEINGDKFNILTDNFAWRTIVTTYNYQVDNNTAASTITHLIELFVAIGLIGILFTYIKSLLEKKELI